MLNTDGAFSYTEIMAMEIGEYIDLIQEIGIVSKSDNKEQPGMTLKQQIEMAENDPAIPIKRL